MIDTFLPISILYFKYQFRIDDLIAIVSSMNFIQRTTAGITWEAGLATMNKEIVDSIKAQRIEIHFLNTPNIHTDT